MIFALILAAGAALFACWLLFALATLALPFFAAMTAGMWAVAHGSGYFGAILSGLIAGIATLLIGRMLFVMVRSPIVRLAIGLPFALPAAIAGYHAVYGLAGIGIDGHGGRQALGLIGALLIGGTAWARMAGGGEMVCRVELAASSRNQA